MNLSIKEYGLACDNAFAQTFIPDRNNFTKRLPIPTAHLRLIHKTCRGTDDDLQWLVAVISDTRMRLAEAAGLLKANIQLDHEILQVSLKPHAWRQLKTANSERVITLSGTSLLYVFLNARTRNLRFHVLRTRHGVIRTWQVRL